MKYEHAEFLSCTFGGTFLGSSIYNIPGAIIGAIIGATISIYAIYKRKK
jgi:uncharacterized protein YqgC (DUF456 family)